MTRRPSPEQQEAVSRRLALLSAELDEVRPDLEAPLSPRPGGAPAPASVEVTRTGSTRRAGWSPLVAPTRADGCGEPEHEAVAAPVVPRPGRHAARRHRRRVAGLLPDTVRGRVALGPAQVALVAVTVSTGLAITTWWVIRGDARTVAAPVMTDPPVLATPAISPPVTPAAGRSGATPAAEKVTVDVAGRVRRPGIAVLAAGSRVVDALEAAGGARLGVDLTGLNLARVLVDGEQILVGRPVPIGVDAVPGAAPTAPTAPTALVNLNTAGMAELETLPDVGPVTAQAIIAWRSEHGGFTSVDELLEVDGIGDATLGTIAPHVTV